MSHGLLANNSNDRDVVIYSSQTKESHAEKSRGNHLEFYLNFISENKKLALISL